MVSINAGTPKWMVYFWENPYEHRDDWGVSPILGTTICNWGYNPITKWDAPHAILSF